MDRFDRVGAGLLSLAWLVLTSQIVVRWSMRATSSPTHEGLIFIAWGLLGSLLLFGRHLPGRACGVWAALGSLTLLLAASLLHV